MNRLTNKAFLQKVKESVHSIDPQADVYLFGSRARGNHRKDSDWDFLVLTSGKVTRDLKSTIRDQLFELELDAEKVISTIIRSKEEWDDYEVTDLYQNIKDDGRQL
ncbi:nucleotidyltransferase domain-containing protein [Larkinella punicea]|uniref:Nucleotidyltransferase domain-containing protein n=1 Tax=Larkinella punicea TaxID=2315727 RepID=A0A368JJS4_9BACT|nr:nucleotidyltransferase domain-containing protein [Larkinella punicea]RCR66934.1 nucleotidyltransferase domain-containing protein [Larkinella punicea]